MLIEHGLDHDRSIEFYGKILQRAVEDENLDWVRYCLENRADPTLEDSFNAHLILAIAATFASIEMSKLLIVWGVKIKDSSALTIASHKGRADLA